MHKRFGTSGPWKISFRAHVQVIALGGLSLTRVGFHLTIPQVILCRSYDGHLLAIANGKNMPVVFGEVANDTGIKHPISGRPLTLHHRIVATSPRG